MDAPLRLETRLDRRRIARIFAASGRAHIAPVLGADCARELWYELAHKIAWQLHLNDGDKAINIAREPFEKLADVDRDVLHKMVYDAASRGFQYLYDSFPISDVYARGEQRGLDVMRFYEFLNGSDFLGFTREVTGLPAIAYADAQATLYRAGHFLTQHDDALAGGNRLVAYVLNLTPQWRPDWGGILQFIDSDGHVAEGYSPAFNALNLFRVPQLHAVSFVTPFARHGRYSITGWLRGTGEVPNIDLER